MVNKLLSDIISFHNVPVMAADRFDISNDDI